MSVDCGKQNWRKKKGDASKNDKVNIAAIVDGDISIVYNESFVNISCYTSD